MPGLFDDLIPSTSQAAPAKGGLFDDLIPAADAPRAPLPPERPAVFSDSSADYTSEAIDPQFGEPPRPLPDTGPTPDRRPLEATQLPEPPAPGAVNPSDFFDPTATAGMDPNGAKPRTGGAVLDALLGSETGLNDRTLADGTKQSGEDLAFRRLQKEQIKADQALEAARARLAEAKVAATPAAQDPMGAFTGQSDDQANALALKQAEDAVTAAIAHKAALATQTQSAGRSLAEGGLAGIIGATAKGSDAGLIALEELTRGGGQAGKVRSGAVDVNPMGDATGLSGDGAIIDNPIRDAATSTRQFLDGLATTDRARKEEFGGEVVQGVGSTVGFMLGGAIGKGLGLSATAATAITGALPQAAQMFREAEAKFGPGPQAWTAFAVGLGLGGSEAAPIARLMSNWEKASGGQFRKLITAMGIQGVEEGGQEYGQSAGEDITQQLLGVRAPKDFAPKAASGAAVGGITGVGMTAATHGPGAAIAGAGGLVDRFAGQPDLPPELAQELRTGPAPLVGSADGITPPPVPPGVAGFRMAPTPPVAAPTPEADSAGDEGVGVPGAEPAAGLPAAPLSHETPAPEGVAPEAAEPGQPETPAEIESPPAPISAPIPEDEARLLLGAGLDPEIIADMSPAERAEDVQHAKDAGVQPFAGDLPAELSPQSTSVAVPDSGAVNEAALPQGQAEQAASNPFADLIPPAANDAAATEPAPKDMPVSALSDATGTGPNPAEPGADGMAPGAAQPGLDTGAHSSDPAFERAKQIVTERGEGSPSYVQRTLAAEGIRLPHAKVRDLFKRMVDEGVLDEPAGGKGRYPLAAPPTEVGANGAKNGRNKPLSLAEFIASKGGIKLDAGGDVKYLGLHNHFVPGIGRLVTKNGNDLDVARQMAVDAGYLTDASLSATGTGPGSGVSTSTTHDLLEGLHRDAILKQRIYTPRDESRIETAKDEKGQDPAQRKREIATALLDYLEEAGLRPHEINATDFNRAIDIIDTDGGDLGDAYERATFDGFAAVGETAHIPEKAGIELPGWDDDVQGDEQAAGDSLDGGPQSRVDDQGPEGESGDAEPGEVPSDQAEAERPEPVSEPATEKGEDRKPVDRESHKVSLKLRAASEQAAQENADGVESPEFKDAVSNEAVFSASSHFEKGYERTKKAVEDNVSDADLYRTIAEANYFKDYGGGTLTRAFWDKRNKKLSVRIGDRSFVIPPKDIAKRARAIYGQAIGLEPEPATEKGADSKPQRTQEDMRADAEAALAAAEKIDTKAAKAFVGGLKGRLNAPKPLPFKESDIEFWQKKLEQLQAEAGQEGAPKPDESESFRAEAHIITAQGKDEKLLADFREFAEPEDLELLKRVEDNAVEAVRRLNAAGFTYENAHYRGDERARQLKSVTADYGALNRLINAVVALGRGYKRGDPVKLEGERKYVRDSLKGSDAILADQTPPMPAKDAPQQELVPFDLEDYRRRKVKTLADAPLKPKADQNFDTDGLALFNDSSKQGDLLDAPPAPKKLTGSKGGEQIGENPYGHPVYEDERGVRSYVADGIRLTEKVGIKPGGGISINLTDRSDAFKTKEEADAEKADLDAMPLPERVAKWKADDRTWAEVLHFMGGANALTTPQLNELVDLWRGKKPKGKPKPVAEADVLAGDSDETVHITVTEDGPWDFNDTWPAPDYKLLEARVAEGRVDFDGAENPARPDAEAIAATLDESLNELVGLLSEAHWKGKKIEDLKANPRKQNADKIDVLERQRTNLLRDFKDHLEGLTDVWGPEALEAVEEEARRRHATEISQTPVAPAAPPSLTDRNEAARAKAKFDPKSADLSEAFASQFFPMRQGFRSILEARKFAKERGVTDPKVVEETLELGVVKAARAVVEDSATPQDAYDHLVWIYEHQPILGTRTSTSMLQQAYSTPVPLAYLASRLAGVTGDTTVYEPSAGNGALLIEADPEHISANELNPDRQKNLEAQGFYTVLARDALDPSIPGTIGPQDVVIANPPFGPVQEDGESKVFDLSDIQPGYNTKEIDHAISLRALAAMKDDGRAVLIIGSVPKQKDRSQSYNGKAKREFFKTLYDRYNVVDHFTVDGDLYKRQGAGWPVDVIVIDGRGKSERKLPAADVPVVLSSWEELKGKLSEQPRRDGPSTGNAVNQDTGGQPDRGAERDRGRAGGSGAAPDGAAPTRQPKGVRGPRNLGEPTSQPDLRQPDVRPDADTSRGGTDGPGAAANPERPSPRVAAPEIEETQHQATYKPASKRAKSLGTLVPVNMRATLADALATVEKGRGDLDSFVSKELGLKPGELEKYFGAEQIDALALALDNFKKGAGFIIGDQTGIGKGRVNAAVIRWAIKNDHIPVFVTKDPALYADMYRDLTATGIQGFLGREPRILMTNTNETVPLDEEGKVVLKTPEGKKHNAALRSFAAAGSIGDYDMVFTTYAQMQTVGGEATERMAFLEGIAPNSVLALDESHNAGGNAQKRDQAASKLDSWRKKAAKAAKDGKPSPPMPSDAPDRAQFARTLVGKSKAVFYSSATYAKRPDVMDLYSKTDMRLAVDGDDPAALGEAIAAGGVPLQQAVASMLTQAGQYVRRERSFAGVSYDVVESPVDTKVYDDFSKALAKVLAFSKAIKDTTKDISDKLKDDAKTIGADNATGSAGAESMNFTSIMHNLINQMLLSINVGPAVEQALEAIARGERPVIALASTNESFLSDFAKDAGLAAGDKINLDFTEMLERYLERSRWISVRKPFMAEGEKAEKVRLTDEQLGPKGRAAWKAASEFLRSTDFSSLPVSPIDAIKAGIQAKGYSVGEITGRSMIVDYGKKDSLLATRPGKERSIAGKRDTIKRFNNGSLDVVILNQSGSTGLSLHASQDFKDQRRRTMIIAQAEGNIDTHMQMLGRVHRTGQVITPSYVQLVPAIPAAKRPAAVLAKKMGSLNANTTASKRSALTAENVPDFMNEYGDRIAYQVMHDDPALNEAMDEPAPLSSEKPKLEGTMRKVTGRIPLLPIEAQTKLYGELERRYTAYIEQLEAEGKNTLEATTLELDAKALDGADVATGEGTSPFAAGVNLTTYDVKRVGKPYTVPEMIADLAEGLGVESLPDNPVKAIEFAEKAGADMMSEMRKTALEGFAVFRQNFLDRMSDPDKIAKQRQRLNEQEEFFKSLTSLAYPGNRVRLVLPGGESYSGVALKVYPAQADASNPIAPGGWSIRVAIPNGMRSMVVPFNRLVLAKDPEGDEIKIEHSGWSEPVASTIDIFEKASKAELREKRVIATGNLLKAFAGVAKGGRIINFTTHEGEVRPGIIMKADNLADALKGLRKPLTFAEAAKRVQDNVGEPLVSNDGHVTLTNDGRGQVLVAIAKAKDKGGRYFLNPDVMSVVGDFYSSGSVMRRTVPVAKVIALTDALVKAGARFSVGTEPDEVDIKASLAPAGPETGGERRVFDYGAVRAAFDHIPDHIRAPVIRGVNEIVARVAPRSTRLLLSDDLWVRDNATDEGYGKPKGDGSKRINAYGLYDPSADVVYVAMRHGQDTAEGTAFHESWHAVKSVVGVTAREQAILDRDRRRMYMLIWQALPKLSEKQLDSWSQEEIEAHAVQAWGLGHRSSQHFIVSAIIEKLWRLLNAVRNLLAGHGFTTYEQIFGDFMEGKLRDRAPIAGPAQTDGIAASTISKSRADEIAQLNALHGMPGQAVAAITPPRTASFKTPTTTRLDKVQAVGQDDFGRLKKIQANIEEARGSPLPEGIDAYLAQSLYRSRTTDATKRYLEDEVNPILDAAAAEKLSLDDVGTFLIAKHASERNATVAQRNIKFNQDGGSGMADGAARDLLAQFASDGKTPALERVAGMVYRLLHNALTKKLNAGLITQEQFDAYTTQWQFYVPLRGSAEDEGVTRRGAGFDIRGKETKAALGRESLSENPLHVAILMGEEAIVRAEKNRADKRLLALARANPNKDEWEVARTPAFTDPATGQRLAIPMKEVLGPLGTVMKVPDVTWMQANNVIGVKVGGKQWYVKLHHPDLAAAYRQLGPDIFGNKAIETYAYLSRQWSMLQTGRNPEWFLKNFIRDVQEMFATLFADSPKLAAKALAKWPRALAAAAAMNTGRSAGSKWDSILAEWQQSGGKIGYNNFHDLEQLHKEIEAHFKKANDRTLKGLPKATWNKFLAIIDGLNDTFESGTRLAAFAAAREAGWSRDKAARLSLESTVNFNRRGRWSKVTNMLWNFSNAGAQGAIKNVQLLMRSRRYAMAYASLAPVGFGISLMSHLMWPDDDDPEKKSAYSKIPEHERRQNLVIPYGFNKETGKIKSVQIPLAFGFKIPWYLGDQLAAVLLGHEKPGKAAWNVIGNTIGAFNPLGEGSPFMQVFPTFVRPAFELKWNTNWRDRPIVPPEQRGREGLPNSSQHFRTNSPTAVTVAQWLNAHTGGDKLTKGYIDLYPGQIEYGFGFLTGGVGRSIMNAAHSAENTWNGIPVPPEKKPFLRQFMKETGFEVDQARYYDEREELQKDRSRLTAANTTLKENPDDKTALRIVEELGDKLNVKVRIGHNLDWKKSVARPFADADKEAKEIRQEQQAIKGSEKLTPLQKHNALEASHTALGKIYRDARRDYHAEKAPPPYVPRKGGSNPRDIIVKNPVSLGIRG